jgi:hypothetical protein
MIDVVMKRDPVSGRERPQEKDFDERPKVVRVVPKNENLRKYLKHGVTKVGFLAEGAVEWPNDQFTRRRLKEGDITIEEAEGEAKAIDDSGAKAADKQQAQPRGAGRRDSEAPPSETSAAVDPNKTTAPKT